MDSHRFPLAPMSRGIYILTLALFILPVALLWLGARSAAAWQLLPGLAVAAIYLFVWLYFRPTRFEIGDAALRIVWPVRRLTVPLTSVLEVELMTGREFRDRYGWGMRVGAGGLWGGFGLLVTRRGTLRFYISRLDGFVLVHRRDERALLVTPDDAERFARLLRERTVTTGG